MEDVDQSFVHFMANEDKLRSFAGRLLPLVRGLFSTGNGAVSASLRILHGEIDTIIPVSHARRLLDAAEFATRRLVTLSKGHNDIFSSEKYAPYKHSMWSRWVCGSGFVDR